MSEEQSSNITQLGKALAYGQQQAAAQRYQARASERERIKKSLIEKRYNSLLVDEAKRIEVRKSLINPRDRLAYERVIGESDLLPISYLEAGLNAAKPVCCIEIHDKFGRVYGYGTGFLVSPSLLLTNNHVLENADAALLSIAKFNYETDLQMMPRQEKSFRLDPGKLFLTNKQLDFTLVAIETASNDNTKLSDFGSLKLNAESGKVLLGEYVSIIQHPGGGAKALVIRENEVKDEFDEYIHYATDTEPGSSGSPVFNDGWTVVALHHAGVPDPNDDTKWVANEGIRISSIMKYINEQRPNLSVNEKALVDELALGIQRPPYAEPGTERLTIGELGKEWYEAASGYDTLFLGDNYEVPLPTLTPGLERDVATLIDGSNILQYTHFSVVMSKPRRLAFFTAVNIDGGQKKDLKRTADKWYFDPRLERKYQCGPELYENNELDRGHLVRRLDPAWGEMAGEASENTFHFTNCAPQHKNLNQKTWQHLEDYILKNAGRYDLKVNVFTGPVLRVDDLIYRREFQIPAEFWKVVVMVKDNGDLSATAYLQTQKNLIDNLEFAYGEYQTYQVPVVKIEQLTGLNFGNLCGHDPIANIEAAVGRTILSAEDIRL